MCFSQIMQLLQHSAAMKGKHVEGHCLCCDKNNVQQVQPASAKQLMLALGFVMTQTASKASKLKCSDICKPMLHSFHPSRSANQSEKKCSTWGLSHCRILMCCFFLGNQDKSEFDSRGRLIFRTVAEGRWP